jgi:2,4-dienoyl-CoA reductase-like NADH-dependent reductase (Old Yellow Enzyme family)
LELTEPLTLKSLRLPNRLVRSATWEGLASRDGECTEVLANMLGNLVTGGVGLVVTGFAFVHPSGRVLPYMLGIEDDRRIEGLRTLTDHIHRMGGMIAVQISHGGAESRAELIGDEVIKVPSIIEGVKRPKLEGEMSLSDIAGMVECYARAAARGRDAGFDAVQIQASHGYLISQFLSPLTNRRTDSYGGTIENRCRFLFEVYESVRTAVGSDFPVLAKMNVSDFMEGGLEFKDALWAMKELAWLGIDAIEVSGGVASAQENGPVRKGVMAGEQEAYFASFTKEVRETIDPVPVIAVGGIRSYDTARNLISSGVADMVAISRPLICEPDLPQRWLHGDSDVSACVSCNRCFLAGLGGKGISCRNKQARP